jgi:hypothetical protein
MVTPNEDGFLVRQVMKRAGPLAKIILLALDLENAQAYRGRRMKDRQTAFARHLHHKCIAARHSGESEADRKHDVAANSCNYRTPCAGASLHAMAPPGSDRMGPIGQKRERATGAIRNIA